MRLTMQSCLARSIASLTCVVAVALFACSKKSAPEGTSAPKLLRVSMIPTTDPGKMARESEPLVAYLEKATGAKVALTVPLNYAAVVEAFGADKVDVAYFGGFTY